MLKQRKQPFYLVSRPTFLSGLARIFDFAGSMKMYNESSNPQDADLVALGSDLFAISKDMRFAIDQEKSAAPKKNK